MHHFTQCRAKNAQLKQQLANEKTRLQRVQHQRQALQARESQLGACISGALERQKDIDAEGDTASEEIRSVSKRCDKARADAQEAAHRAAAQTRATSSQTGDYLALLPLSLERLDMLEGEHTRAMGEYARRQLHDGPGRAALQEDHGQYAWLDVLSPQALAGARSEEALREMQGELQRLQHAEVTGEGKRCEAAVAVAQLHAETTTTKQLLAELGRLGTAAVRIDDVRFDLLRWNGRDLISPQCKISVQRSGAGARAAQGCHY